MKKTNNTFPNGYKSSLNIFLDKFNVEKKPLLPTFLRVEDIIFLNAFNRLEK